MNLYLVHMLRYQAYVLANDPDEAYKKMRTLYDEQDLGFYGDRELRSIELIAVTNDHQRSWDGRDCDKV